MDTTTPFEAPAFCPNCHWPLDETVSRIDIEAVTPDLPEGTAEAGRAIEFLVKRSGPDDVPCRVGAYWSGTVDAGDFADGTGQRGTLSWAAGVSEPRKITLTLKQDDKVEPDETVTITLIDPVDCTIGEAEAKVTIINDDVAIPEPPEPEPPEEATPDDTLPYGGLGIGTACLLGQPGNQKVYTHSSIMILCERSGTIDRISWQNRINGHGRTGYSDGDGGTIDWICRIVPDPKAATIHPGSVIGQTRKIVGAGVSRGWVDEYKAAGGKGAPPLIFVEIPTIRFVKPFHVKRGDMLLFTQRQSGKGAVSINNNYSTCRTFKDWSPYRGHDSCRQFKGTSLSTRRPEHFPLILIGYTDGVVKGTGVMGYSAGLTQSQESIELSGSTRARQVFKCPEWADGKTIKAVTSFWGRTTKETSGNLRCRIRLAGDKPGGSQDEGQALAESTLLASQVAYRPDIKNGSPTPLLRHNFGSPAKLQGGKTYYVVMETAGGSTRYRGSRCVRWLSYPPVGLQNADWALKGMEGQRDAGGGWKSLKVSDVIQDVPLWCGF
jgi:hypothetical protein